MQTAHSQFISRAMNSLNFVSFLIVIGRGVFGFLSEFTVCQDDFTLKPPDGMLKRNTFTWLGFVQYTHIISLDILDFNLEHSNVRTLLLGERIIGKGVVLLQADAAKESLPPTTGLPHHSKAPRVLLIHKQFVVGTATDMLHMPKNYKLGNVVFGEYERDEADCGMRRTQLKLGLQCPPAYIEIPPMDITPHPEYSRFGVGNSLALVKLLRPMKSHYMVPVCLPSLRERYKKNKNKYVFMVDYISNVPRDFDTERMGKKTMRLYTHKECRRHRMKAKIGREGVTHVLCTSGCGVRPGAPIISHNSFGGFELIGLAAGGAPCTRKVMRRRLIKEPPLYIDVYPYVTWMVNVITAFELPLPYPQNFKLVDGGTTIALRKDFMRTRKKQKQGWRSRTFLNGNFCYRPPKKQNKYGSFFYSERFEVTATLPAKFTILMQISAGIECTILCARLMMPNRMIRPKIEGVGGYNITVSFGTGWFPFNFFYTLGLVGKNTTESDMVSWKNERSRGFW